MSGSLVSLMASMMLVSLTPDASSATVFSRSAAGGPREGFTTIAGIVAADVLLICIALSGFHGIGAAGLPVALLARFAGGAFLLWLAVGMWRAGPDPELGDRLSAGSSFAAGFLITVTDPKDLAFYLGFLQAFVDLEHVSWRTFVGVCGAAAIAIGVAKGLYILAAAHAANLLRDREWATTTHRLAAALVGVVGIAIIVSGVRLMTGQP